MVAMSQNINATALQRGTSNHLFHAHAHTRKGTPCGPGSRCRGMSVAFGSRLLTGPIDVMSITRCICDRKGWEETGIAEVHDDARLASGLDGAGWPGRACERGDGR